MINVIIVEDEPAIARGLSLLITQNYCDFQVLSLCRNGKDGLQKILELKPDLIFTDISMPIMNGLDMIQELRSQNINTHCVILTGYAEFDYARTAITLGVSDYLLKPISPDTLDRILTSFRSRHQSSLRSLRAEYLQKCLFDTTLPTDGNFPLMSCSCTLLFLFFGSMCGNLYHETIISSEIPNIDNQFLQDLEQKHKVSLFLLRGKHYNEKVLAIVAPVCQPIEIENIAQQFFKIYTLSDTPLNLVVSNTITDGQGIEELARTTYLYALFKIPFGNSSIQKYQPLTNEPIHVSTRIKQLCGGIPDRPSKDNLKDFIHSLIDFWSKQQVTQFQLLTDVRYFISTVIHEHLKEDIIYPDPAEIVASSHSYPELEKELLFETNRIYGFNNSMESAENQHSLAYQVKNWLDKNFTSQITYKIFQDLFGHNEKYLSTLFKDEFGISPSKYIGELRLNMAKNLMESNPDILLKDVADMVGFTDAFYFSRVFKTHEGISPSAFMRNQKCKKEL